MSRTALVGLRSVVDRHLRIQHSLHVHLHPGVSYLEGQNPVVQLVRIYSDFAMQSATRGYKKLLGLCQHPYIFFCSVTTLRNIICADECLDT
jgi:hypothetical protein